MTTYFVSGHLDLTEEEFRDHYAPRLSAALADDPDAAFVVGDARGCDRMAQRYLCDVHADRVRVFHRLGAPRNNEGGSPTVGGFPSDDARDVAMTAVSDADIAWVRPGRERSGTAANLARRATAASQLAGAPGRCHAGAGHDVASDCGAFGWLCTDCFARVTRLLKRA